MKSCQVSSKSGVNWCHFCREVCIAYLDAQRNPCIGGVGKIVEIDESKFGKHKYNRGRLTDGKWVLDGVERGADNMFLEIVFTRDTRTLLAVGRLTRLNTVNPHVNARGASIGVMCGLWRMRGRVGTKC